MSAVQKEGIPAKTSEGVNAQPPRQGGSLKLPIACAIVWAQRLNKRLQDAQKRGEKTVELVLADFEECIPVSDLTDLPMLVTAWVTQVMGMSAQWTLMGALRVTP